MFSDDADEKWSSKWTGDGHPAKVSGVCMYQRGEHLCMTKEIFGFDAQPQLCCLLFHVAHFAYEDVNRYNELSSGVRFRSAERRLPSLKI